MLFAIVIVVGFVLYAWARGKERAAQEQRALRRFSFQHYLSEDSDDAWDDWEADLVSMTVCVRRFVPERESTESDALPLRRSSKGRWSVRNKDETGKRWWQPVPAEVAAPLEAQYQRFVLHYRRG